MANLRQAKDKKLENVKKSNEVITLLHMCKLFSLCLLLQCYSPFALCQSRNNLIPGFNFTSFFMTAKIFYLSCHCQNIYVTAGFMAGCLQAIRMHLEMKITVEVVQSQISLSQYAVLYVYTQIRQCKDCQLWENISPGPSQLHAVQESINLIEANQ